ncbi:probable mediator of RNA polymerase II transcription subunit 26c isoform X1 [Salvia hispanica]|uniref:probable mediator of RNA polymerase II transcription subunit 26c isoform X1 n=1 Tax=Salvia hispanica TaxID=49212 RepID=UPI0020091792|nr:probable mediator of RNA polymerase II transcription subunit 26c isoform X1 [Salvia hispanica]
MDLNSFRSFISDSGIDVWTCIDMAISVASADHEVELRNRRDGIVEKLFAPPCQNCVEKKDEIDQQSLGLIDDEADEQRKILEIRNLLDDHSQNERYLIEMLQRLLEMNTSFITLKNTEIGRHVTKLRKHSSSEVRRLVKIVIRKWKETVDEWVKQNTPIEEEEVATEFNGDARSHPNPPKRKARDNGVLLNHEGYQESQYAKKQVKDISKLKNSVVSNNGGRGSVLIIN